MAKDFSQGKVWKSIVSQSIPLILAQLVQLLYNVVDRIYIGHMPDIGSIALTGIGLVFPITSLVAAFTNLFGTGGSPLFAIARGEKKDERAEQILGNTFSLLLICSIALVALCYIFKRPVLYIFGASDESYVYANEYLKIYLIGTPFIMISTGLNGFINAQGYPATGMMTTVIGAALNIILDPIFIFVFGMGISGAAVATVISQAASAAWVIKFLTGRKAALRIRKEYLYPKAALTKEITALGLAGFIMRGTNCLVQVVYNSTLKIFGGDIYIGIMTIVNSVNEIMALPIDGLRSGAQPVIGFNYGARKYERVKQCIRFMTAVGVIYMIAAWIFVIKEPNMIMSVFTNDEQMIKSGAAALHIYFFGFFFMALQFTGQTVFTALGYSKQAIFFSLLRKAVIVAPLAMILPRLGFGVNGVFAAEPISNAIGGISCFLTMRLTVYRHLGETDKNTAKNNPAA